MIGKIIIGKSFKGCIHYCLHDKNQKQINRTETSIRAEILSFNQCYGNSGELIRQFSDVRMLNQKLAKPVMHIILSLAPGEKLPEDKLNDIVQSCSLDLGFSTNQYIAALHKDTSHQHLHIVINRIGFDGKTISDSNNYRKIAEFCRQMEERHSLIQVQSPKRFLSKELKQSPRLDSRKQKLKDDIKHTLEHSKGLDDFIKKMQMLNYEVIKSRGIAFRDSKKVYTKGSEVGYSLATLEKVMNQKHGISEPHNSKSILKPNHSENQLVPQQIRVPKDSNLAGQDLIKTLLDPDYENMDLQSSELLKEARKRKKRQRPRL